ncbi:MAG: hypothetical protein WD894_05760 [Pirellulales bacterium]
MAACRTRRTWPWIVGSITGCLLVAFSFAGKLLFKPEQAWPPEKATEYTQVGMKLHKLSYEMRPGRGAATRAEDLRKLSAAREEYQQTRSRWEELREELETAKKRGQMPLAVLRWTGAGIALFCIAGWLATRPSR